MRVAVCCKRVPAEAKLESAFVGNGDSNTGIRISLAVSLTPRVWRHPSLLRVLTAERGIAVNKDPSAPIFSGAHYGLAPEVGRKGDKT